MAEASLKCRCGSDYLVQIEAAKFYAPSKMDRGVPLRLRPVSGEKRVKYVCFECGKEVWKSPVNKPQEPEKKGKEDSGER
jgi:hypothetical protein